MTSGDLADPRPAVSRVGDEWRVEGWVCDRCGYRGTSPKPRCPTCRGSLVATAFGPQGRVWAATVLRVPIADRTPPMTFAYVDFDDGPRLLCYVAGEAGSDIEAPRPGATVALAGVTETGDPLVRCVQ